MTITAQLDLISAQFVDLSWKDAYLHELRDAHGRWVRDNDALLKAATGRRAGAVRTHDHVLYSKAETRPDGLGLQSVMRPMEVTQVRHHWEGRGKNKKRFTDLDLQDPETGETYSESVKDGASVKIFEREAVRSALRAERKAGGGGGGGGRAAPVPASNTVQGFDWSKLRPKDAAPEAEAPAPPRPAPPRPSPRPAAATPAPAGKHYGHVSTVRPDEIPDPAVRQAAIAEVQQGLDRQARFIPGLARKEHITFANDVSEGNGGRTVGLNLGPNEIMVAPKITEAVAGDGARQDLQRATQSGYWVPSDPQYTLPNHVVAHEMGHSAASRMSREDMLSLDLWGPLAQAIGLPPPSGQVMPTDMRGRPVRGAVPVPDVPGWVDQHKAELARAVSGYGSSNIMELEAELWAEYTMSSSPRPAAKIYGDYMMARLPGTVTS